MKYLITILLFFASCSTSKKVTTQVKSNTQTDSSFKASVDSAAVKTESVAEKETKSEQTVVNLEYEPAVTDPSEYLEVNINGNKWKIPTKGLKKVNTGNKKDADYSFTKLSKDSSVTIRKTEVKLDKKEIIDNKSSTEIKGWVADLFGGSLNKLVYIVSGFLILIIIGSIIFFIIKRRKKRKHDQRTTI